jgi:predicted YcjX-like family ATPase
MFHIVTALDLQAKAQPHKAPHVAAAYKAYLYISTTCRNFCFQVRVLPSPRSVSPRPLQSSPLGEDFALWVRLTDHYRESLEAARLANARPSDNLEGVARAVSRLQDGFDLDALTPRPASR